jgi:hypothetical protein
MILPLLVLECSFNNYTVTFQRDARGVYKVHSSKKVNAYDVDDMVMPLHRYINDPVAHEIIHNGATFQVQILYMSTSAVLFMYNFICLLSVLPVYWELQIVHPSIFSGLP